MLFRSSNNNKLPKQQFIQAFFTIIQPVELQTSTKWKTHSLISPNKAVRTISSIFNKSLFMRHWTGVTSFTPFSDSYHHSVPTFVKVPAAVFLSGVLTSLRRRISPSIRILNKFRNVKLILLLEQISWLKFSSLSPFLKAHNVGDAICEAIIYP